MFRLMIALPLIATFALSLPVFSAPTRADQDTEPVYLKGGVENDPSG